MSGVLLFCVLALGVCGWLLIAVGSTDDSPRGRALAIKGVVIIVAAGAFALGMAYSLIRWPQ